MKNLIIILIWWVPIVLGFVLWYFLDSKFIKNQAIRNFLYSKRKLRRNKFYNFTDNELRALFTILCNVIYMDPYIDNLIIDIYTECKSRDMNHKSMTDINLKYLFDSLSIVELYLDQGKLEEYRKLIDEYTKAYDELISLKLSNSNIDIDSFSNKYKLIFQKTDKNYFATVFDSKSAEFFVSCLDLNKSLLSYIDKIIMNKKEN